jgi:ATP-dependent helicase HrpB
VLQAPPGAGKTTLVPLALLNEPWLAGQRIVMLEPRRLAARAAARRMAELLGERVGETVGYRVRLDSRVGARTRIEVVTEGILTRRLRDDPGLEGVGLVIFDEFHERSLQADLGLALTLETRAVLREDLRLLVMSATLEGGPIAALLGRAPVVTSEGRMHSVEVRYRPRRPEEPVEAATAGAVRDVLEAERGDVLVFLPGAGEIRRVEERLLGAPLPADVDVLPLHGTLSAEAQDAAIRPALEGRRKVVLATSIAETSLTIEGVRVVVDAGLARLPRFSPRSGMTRLETVRVSRAAAEQRAGRAGRLGPGICYRLWSAPEQAQLIPFAPPEIVDADLAPLALDLAAAGITDPATLRWLDLPPAPAYAQAQELLRELGSLDAAGRITAEGRAMAALAAHPRLAHMLLRAAALGEARLGAELAALIEERDVLRGDGGPPPADLALRLDLVRERGRPQAYAHGATVDRDAVRRVRELADAWRRQLGAGARAPADSPVDPGLLLAFAYPDRIAQRRPGGSRFLLRNGLGAAFGAGEPLAQSPWIVVAELDGRRPESRIFRAVALDGGDLLEHFGDQIERDDVLEWDGGARRVRARRRERLGALVLSDAPLAMPDVARAADVVIDAVRREGLELLPWTDVARQVRQRLAFLHQLDGSWPDVSDAALLAELEAWLLPALLQLRRPDDWDHLDLAEALRAQLDWRLRSALDRLAPSHVVVPTGSRIAVDYSDPAAPVLAVRLQELFGLADTPHIADGAVPLTLQLLSPARRPVQVTRDLAGFWARSYFDVRKDLRGRYPKHHWPDDPMQAEPTRRAKPRGT